MAIAAALPLLAARLQRITIAEDATKWITTKNGHHALIDGETGEIKAGMGGVHNGERIQSRDKAFSDFVGNIAAKVRNGQFHATGVHLEVGDLDKDVTAFLRKKNIYPSNNQIVMRDDDIIHSLRSIKTNQLPIEMLEKMPKLLQNPKGIYWDKQKDGLIYAIEDKDTKGKAVVLVECTIGKGKKKQIVNLVRTGARVKDFSEFFNKGRYEVVKP